MRHLASKGEPWNTLYSGVLYQNPASNYPARAWQPDPKPILSHQDLPSKPTLGIQHSPRRGPPKNVISRCTDLSLHHLQQAVVRCYYGTIFLVILWGSGLSCGPCRRLKYPLSGLVPRSGARSYCSGRFSHDEKAANAEQGV